MNSTASSNLIPPSIRAIATRTGALPSPATQCTATALSGLSLNIFLVSLSHSLITVAGGCSPSSNINSCTRMPSRSKSLRSIHPSVWDWWSLHKSRWRSFTYWVTLLLEGRSIMTNRMLRYIISAGTIFIVLQSVIVSVGLLSRLSDINIVPLSLSGQSWTEQCSG
eukprot:sb/3472461/